MTALRHRTREIPPPHDQRGQRVKVLCDDINCNGKLVYDHYASALYHQHIWNCDGLTHEGDHGELTACTRAVHGGRREGFE